MFTQQTFLEKALSTVAVLLLLTTAEQSAMLTTAAPPLPNASLTTQHNNSSMDEPKVLPSYRSCRSEHEKYCENGGKCIYPQDSDKPSCICTPSYSGPRCMFFSELTHSPPELEKVIGVCFAVVIFICFLATIIYCFVSKRCNKPGKFMKIPSRASV
ncbi:epigen [Mastacembelus armatus]|uniref:Epithelial mitogen homolog (mouse) n=1 Tax=Mastacembelus armatus TaxID=205130 RepID=A0A3Q3LX30_9TELE|nr:epigen [Mastacembelus armatus]